MPSAQKTTAYFYFAMYPELEETVMQLRAQKKPLACYIPLSNFHDWSENKNGIRYCLKCGKVDFYFGLTGVIRHLEEKGKL